MMGEVDAKSLAKKAVKAGIFAPMVAKELGGTPLPNGVKVSCVGWIE